MICFNQNKILKSIEKNINTFGKNREVYVIWVLQEVYHLPTQSKSIQFIAYDWQEHKPSKRELCKIAIDNENILPIGTSKNTLDYIYKVFKQQCDGVVNIRIQNWKKIK